MLRKRLRVPSDHVFEEAFPGNRERLVMDNDPVVRARIVSLVEQVLRRRYYLVVRTASGRSKATGYSMDDFRLDICAEGGTEIEAIESLMGALNRASSAPRNRRAEGPTPDLR